MMPSEPSGTAIVALRMTNEKAFLARVREVLSTNAPGDRMLRASKILKVSRSTIARWIRRYPELGDAK
jgi:transposase